jgi:hypothetical protein
MYFQLQKTTGSGSNLFRTRSQGFGILLNHKRNQWSSSGQNPNPNPNFRFGPVWFGFGLRFRTEPSHHYKAQLVASEETMSKETRRAQEKSRASKQARVEEVE